MNQKEYYRRHYEKAKPAYAALMKCYPFNVDDLDGEVWQKLDEHYHVSNFGRTKSFYNGKAKILKPNLISSYLSVALYKDGKSKWFRVHQLVASTFIPNPDNKPQVNHIDGCKFNNFVGNLEWCTQSENQQHAVDTGLYKQGEDNHNAKLTSEQVIYIRHNPDNLLGEQLAEQFGIAPTVISKIQLGKIWKNAGGTIRKAQKPGDYWRIPDEIRTEIRRLRNLDRKKYTYKVLGEMFGVTTTTVWKIVHEITSN